MTAYTIARTRPDPADGISMPCFIHNGNYYLSSLDVFADGSFDAWEFKDRKFLLESLKSGWVRMSPPDGARVSVHNLGSFAVSRADWSHDDDETFARAISLLDELNPVVDGRRQRELVDFKGTDVELRDGARYAKMGLSDAQPYRLADGERRIAGRRVHVIDCRGDIAALEWMTVYADGLFQLGEGRLWHRQEVTDAFESGALLTHVDDDSALRLHDLGVVHVTQGFWSTTWQERIKEFADLLVQLQGSTGVVQQTRLALEAYDANPTPETREHLRECYFAVPEHLRLYCGDMDSKDWPIRSALGLFDQDEGDAS